jgi:hypothetical protein
MDTVTAIGLDITKSVLQVHEPSHICAIGAPSNDYIIEKYGRTFLAQ